MNGPHTGSKASAEMVARAALTLLQPMLARKSLRHFVLRTMPNYQMARHHWLIMSALEMVERGLIRFLIINMPPRHGKSEIVSVRFPAWYLGRHPSDDVIHVSYGSDLSNDFSRRVRALVRDDPNFRALFPRITLDPERQRINDWRTFEGGGFRSVGTGGGISGHGANLLIIDDPHKEGEITPSGLKEVFDWYSSAARLRLMPGAKIVICMTRWDLRDLVGQVIRAANANPAADQWLVLDLPGLAMEADPLGRLPGEALWPEWYPVEALLALKALSEPHFEALIQQNPRALNIEMFDPTDWRRVPNAVVENERAAWCFDLALGEDDASDYTAWSRVTYNKTSGEMAFGHLFRERLTWPQAKTKIEELFTLFPDDDFAFPKHMLELMAVQTLRHDHPEMRLKAVSFPAHSDKRSRAQVLAERVKARKVLISACDLVDYWVQEHTDFPGEFDDCVDVCSVATHYFGLQNEFSAAIADLDAKARRKAEYNQLVSDTVARIGGSRVQ